MEIVDKTTILGPLVDVLYHDNQLVCKEAMDHGCNNFFCRLNVGDMNLVKFLDTSGLLEEKSKELMQIHCPFEFRIDSTELKTKDK
jgi:hypothetical protein